VAGVFLGELIAFCAFQVDAFQSSDCMKSLIACFDAGKEEKTLHGNAIMGK
jgi:hypothetical protein